MGGKSMSLEIRKISKSFGGVKALDDVSLSVETGEMICFLGPSGCGKTTLLRIIAGLEYPDGGSMYLDGRDLSSLPARKRNFGVVFQSYSLFPNLSAAANVAYGLECRRWPGEKIRKRVEEMLALVHLGDHARKLPHQLSGGQQQRVALARALAPEPSLLLLDEPLSALDAQVREELQEEIRRVQQHLKITTIMVTHDQEEALSMADRVMVMKDGTVMQTGPPMDIYKRPENSFVARFIGKMNVLPAQKEIPFQSHVAAEGSRPRIIGIRPEDVQIACCGREEGTFSGVVDQVVRLGNLTRVSLRVESTGGREKDLLILSELQGMGEGLEVGASLPLCIQPENVRVLEWH
ncbi:ABC transporter ATP-binding protein [Desulfobotulus alkaliphilus]|nr:ATP-binding cassette domain-containing protein [Desulfobotulus alkaliphilus]